MIIRFDNSEKMATFAYSKSVNNHLNVREMKSLALNQIIVSTRLYEREYCKLPKGRGSWAFSIGGTQGYDDVTKAFFTNSMTYREAVKVAKLEAQKKGADVVYVLP